MKLILIYFQACLLIIFSSACSHPRSFHGKRANIISDSIINHLQTASVRLEDDNSFIKLNGKIQPNEAKQVRVFSLVSGKVHSVNVELGDFVKKGQLLAVLNSIEVAEVSNNLTLAESNVTMARKNLEMAKDMYEGRLANERDYLNAKISYNNAVSELNRASQVASITGGNRSNYPVKAPINGFVIEKNITNNSEVRPDNNSDLFVIADLSNVWIIANVYESDLNKVDVGDPVTVKTLANAEKNYPGTIDKIYNVLDPETRTMKVRISMDNPDNELKPEMFATVKVNIRSTGKSLAVPSQALVMDNSKYYVVVRKADKLEAKEINLIKRVDNKAFISGLSLGDEVVVNSQVFLYQALSTN